MPDLPTLTVTQAQADRMLAVFGTVEAYREWLRESIINHVLAEEEQVRVEQFHAELVTRRNEGQHALGLARKDPA